VLLTIKFILFINIILFYLKFIIIIIIMALVGYGVLKYLLYFIIELFIDKKYKYIINDEEKQS